MRRFAPIALALILTLAACSGAPGDPTGPATPGATASPEPSSSPTRELPQGVVPFPHDVAAQDGLRYAADAFTPAFTFSGQASPIPYFGVRNDPDTVELHSGETALVFLRPNSVYEESAEPVDLPEDLGAWLAGHPALTINDSGVAHLAGIEGTRFDLTVETDLEPTPSFCDEPCRPLFGTESDGYAVPAGIVIVAHVFELSDGPLLVLVDGERDAVDTALPLAEDLMESVEFLTT